MRRGTRGVRSLPPRRAPSRPSPAATASTIWSSVPRQGSSRTRAIPGQTSRNQIVTAARSGDDVQPQVVKATASTEQSKTGGQGPEL